MMYLITEEQRNAIMQALSSAIHPNATYAAVAQLMQAVHDAPESEKTDNVVRPQP